MIQFSPEELSQWVSSPWRNRSPDTVVTGVSTDTRTLNPGDLYVAVRGDNFDGHAFIADAFAKGAVGALVTEGFEWTHGPILTVPDTIQGLQDLARGYRNGWTAIPIGITGSVGKTTVKEMCADILSEVGKTHRTCGNYNNHIGLPLTMLSMPSDAKYGVFEIGMNHPGEIAVLTDLLRPQIGILTDICNSHRESFESLEAIAREKAELPWSVPSSGTVILDCDSEWHDLVQSHLSAREITVSYEGNADYTGHYAGALTIDVNGYKYEVPLPGEHIMRNALRAIALGLELEVEPDQINRGLAKFTAPPMRWAKSTVNGVEFINDAYNANPLSMRAALRTFYELPLEGGKWVVVGGMRELGVISDVEHAALGEYIDGLGFDGVITVGVLGKGILCKSTCRFFQCPTSEEAVAVLKDNLSAGDSVLLKASRGEHLELVLKDFREI
ncbi:MAG TPA: UDP-N-acetylmuramoyl-tripeptide--D-alanyl-D-alanine ligase [Pontiella sp.]